MEIANKDNMKEEDCFLFSHQAALLMDFKTYFAVKALINDRRECKRRSPPLLFKWIFFYIFSWVSSVIR